MAQHDYVIDNSTGANVRADINSVLQAIASNNSGSSAPSTTYALQSFANTTDSMLQLRNAANNAFVNLRKFDGTLPLPDGSVSSPSLFFDDDTNTGIFSSAADTFNVATGGVERMELGATTIFNEDGADVDFRIEGDTNANLFYLDAGNDRVGIGLNNPNDTFHVFHATDNQVARFESGDTGAGITLKDNTHVTSLLTTNGAFEINVDLGGDITGESIDFKMSGSSKMFIDSSGSVFVGKTSASFSTTGVELHANGLGVFSRSGLGALAVNRNTNDGTAVSFMRSGTEVGKISVTTSSTSYSTSASDRSLKKNFEDWTENTLNLFKNIKPQKFNFIFQEDTEAKTKGYIAQDLIDSFPEAYPKDDDDKYMFNPSGMVVYLMKAIQELEAKVAALEAA